MSFCFYGGGAARHTVSVFADPANDTAATFMYMYYIK